MDNSKVKVWSKNIQDASNENILSSLQEDSFQRNWLVMNFVRQISNAQGPLSISLDGPWGSGKTFFVKQAKILIENVGSDDEFWKKFCVDLDKEEVARIHDIIPVYYDAWQNDNDTDPILSVIYSIVENEEIKARAGIPKKIDSEKLKEALGNILCLAVDIGINPLADKVLKSIKSFGDSWTSPELFNAYEKQQKANKGLRSAIEKFFIDIRESYCLNKTEQELNRKKIIIFIDELDRCRPDFAVRLLERVKHYADLPNVIFVMSTNLTELQYMIRNVYGGGFDAARYLDRFFDIHMVLPEIQDDIIFSYFKIFSNRKNESVLRAIVRYFKMSLREIFRYMKWYRMVELYENSRLRGECYNGWRFCIYYVFPYMIALKLIDLSRYQLFVSGDPQEASRFASFIIETMSDSTIKTFFPDKDDEPEMKKENLVEEITTVLTTLWHDKNVLNAADESYENAGMEIRRSFGHDMINQLSLVVN